MRSRPGAVRRPAVPSQSASVSIDIDRVHRDRVPAGYHRDDDDLTVGEWEVIEGPRRRGGVAAAGDVVADGVDLAAAVVMLGAVERVDRARRSCVVWITKPTPCCSELAQAGAAGGRRGVCVRWWSSWRAGAGASGVNAWSVAGTRAAAPRAGLTAWKRAALRLWDRIENHPTLCGCGSTWSAACDAQALGDQAQAIDAARSLRALRCAA